MTSRCSTASVPFRLPIPSQGARWSFQELVEATDTVNAACRTPLEETEKCIIYPGICSYRNTKRRRLNTQCNNDNNANSFKTDDDQQSERTLQRIENPKWIYYPLERKGFISLNHHEKNWGQVWFALAIAVDKRSTTASSSNKIMVAVKQLNKAVVADYLLANGPENPYTEVARLQRLSEEPYVLNCLEALQDKCSLYIVTPRAPGGTLYDLVFNVFAPLSEQRIHFIFVQLLHILILLERENIHHRDLSPDNLLIFENDQIKVMDFALSMLIPKSKSGHRILLSSNIGTFGTHAYMAPELVQDEVFDGVSADLWSVMVILYNLQTRHKLYDHPLATDWSFRYFILHQGLARERMNQALLHAPLADGRLRERARAHLWTSNVRIILGHSLKRNPRDRWTLAQVIESDYVQQTPIQ